MGVLDFAALVYVAYGVFKGRKRGFFKELPGALSVFVFFVTGCGLYRWAGRALAEMNQLAGQSLGVGGFVGLVVGVFVVVHHFQKRVSGWAEQRFEPDTQRRAGGVAGGVRTFTVVAIVLLVFAHWPLRFLTRPLAEGSWLGRTLTTYVLPVYDKTHGAF